jgi:dTDP-4-amino-4,6-dideoxygalactose transaminase
MADMNPILEVARVHNLAVIEDAAQAHGATYHSRRAGSLGDFGCFSFYPTKNLGACGEGGIVVTNDPGHDRTLRSLRDWGQSSKYNYARRGFNHRMDNLQAALLRVKLTRLDRWTAQRRAHAASYDSLLADLPLSLPRELEHRLHVYHLYVVRLPDRDTLRAALRERGVQSEVHYPVPVHLIEAWCGRNYSPGDFPVSERAAAEVLSLPLYAELDDISLRHVAASIREALA